MLVYRRGFHHAAALLPLRLRLAASAMDTTSLAMASAASGCAASRQLSLIPASTSVSYSSSPNDVLQTHMPPGRRFTVVLLSSRVWGRLFWREVDVADLHRRAEVRHLLRVVRLVILSNKTRRHQSNCPHTITKIDSPRRRPVTGSVCSAGRTRVARSTSPPPRELRTSPRRCTRSPRRR